jgi:G3E family GTPase
VIGVLVLTGFLGSGKTTLLRYLLHQPAFSRTAVIINEFGEIGLDHELIEASTDSFIELQTGCLCCKIRNDLIETLDDMLRRRDQSTVPAFNRIVIETSGLADPAPILQTLMTNAAGHLVLEGMVATVDAVNGSATLGREPICAKQLALADRLVLTKSDLAIADQRALLGRLAVLNPAAPVVTADHGKIDPRALEGIAFDPHAKSPAITAWLGEAAAGHSHVHDRHDSEIQTYAIVRHEPIHAVALTLFLEALAEHCGGGLLRLKGIVSIAESPGRPAVIHGVQHVFHPPAWLAHWPSDDRRTRIVFITRGIPRRWVEVLLDALDAEVRICRVGYAPQSAASSRL